jgi:hypothetical protein
MTQPSHIQIGALADDKWGWVVWFGGDEDSRDRDGIADSLEAALQSVSVVIYSNPPPPAPVDALQAGGAFPRGVEARKPVAAPGALAAQAREDGGE